MVVGAVGIALGGVLGAVVARAALVPIARFTARTERLRQEADLSERMEVVGDDELARLARSFNATLDALERSVEAQRHLVADASHELRTPIASLRANIQMLGDADRLPPASASGCRPDILGELDELTSLVGDVVELARGAKPAERPGRRAPGPGGRRRGRARAPARAGRRDAGGRRAGADAGPRRAGPDRPRGDQPDRQRRQVEPRRRRGGDRPARRRAVGARPRPRLRRARTCRTCSSASTARPPPGARRARGWGWRSWPRRPRPTAASPRPPTPTGAARCCGSGFGEPLPATP